MAIRSLHLNQMDLIVDIDPGRAVIQKLSIILLVTLVHRLVYLCTCRVVVLHREALSRHQVLYGGKLRSGQRPKSHEDFGFRRHPSPVHFPVQRPARVRRIDVKGLKRQPILSDVLDDIRRSNRKPCLGQI